MRMFTPLHSQKFVLTSPENAQVTCLKTLHLGSLGSLPATGPALLSCLQYSSRKIAPCRDTAPGMQDIKQVLHEYCQQT